MKKIISALILRSDSFGKKSNQQIQKKKRRHQNGLQLLLLCLFPLFVSLSACTEDKPPADVTPAQSVYQTAKTAYDAGDYASAINGFETVLSGSPDAVTKEKAEYYLGLSYYYSAATDATLYQTAITKFTNLINDPGASSYIPGGHYWRGRSYQKLADTQSNQAEVSTYYQNAIDDYNAVIGSGSVYEDNAVFQVANANYEHAVYLVRLNPASESNFQTAYDLLVQVVDVSMVSFFNSYPDLASSSYFDDAVYFKARAYQRMGEILQAYPVIDTVTDTSRFMQAITEFDRFDVATGDLSTSPYQDAALYFAGRTYHEQTVPDFINARIRYGKLVTNFPASTWRDDAQYQIAKTYYDNALLNLVNAPSQAFADLQTGIAELNKILLNPTDYVDHNRTDNAYYYRGRSFHHLTELAQTDNALLASVDVTLQPFPATQANPPLIQDMYSVAVLAYQSFLDWDTANQFNGSYTDNAQFYIGDVYRLQASNAATDAEILALLAQAESAYLAVAALPRCANLASCASADNAQYNLGLVYNDALPVCQAQTTATGICVLKSAFTSYYDQARAAFIDLYTLFPSSTWVDNAYYRIASLTLDQAGQDQLAATYNTALDQFIQFINYDQTSQYIDNAIYSIGLIYYQAEVNAGAGCTLADNWFQVYLDMQTNATVYGLPNGASTTVLDPAVITGGLSQVTADSINALYTPTLQCQNQTGGVALNVIAAPVAQ